MALISEEVRDEIRSAARIEQVAGRYTELRGTGTRLKGLCPLHDERTPSFMVRVDQGRWHCFGCGRGGDVFDLVMENEQVRFPEAVEIVAGWAGIILPDSADDPVAVARAENIRLARQVMERAQGWFSRWLAADQAPAAAARRRLADLRFTAAAAADWEVGYAPPTRRAVSGRLPDLAAETLTFTGPLARRRGDGQLVDRMADRIVWSLRDERGRLVGFAGRVNGDLPTDGRWPADGGGKYVNPDGGSLFDKSRILYAYHRARQQIMHTQQAVIVEGYTDAMAMHLAGATNTVAQCGTAFTDGQARLLGRLLQPGEGEVLSVLDGDQAGWDATWKQFLVCQDVLGPGVRHRVAVLPPGEDPCSLRATRGDAAIIALTASARPTVEVAIERTVAGVDLTDPEAKQSAVVAVQQLLKQVKSEVLRDGYAERAAALLRVDEAAVTGKSAGTPKAPRVRPVDNGPVEVAGVEPVERRVLWALLDDPQTRAGILAAEPDVAFLFGPVAQQVASAAINGDAPGWQRAFELEGDPGRLVSMLAVGHVQPAGLNLGREVSGLRVLALGREIAEIQQWLAETDPADTERRRRLAAALPELLRDHRRLLRETARDG